MRAPNIGSWNSERTRPSPCSPECEPLYSRTIAKASSAIARILLDVELLLQVEHRPHMQACRPRHARTRCRRCRASRTPAVSRSVYSARSSSATAQSSMKETGFPSPFIDIMMLRPALRTSHDRALEGRVGRLDDGAGEAEIAHQLDELPEAAQVVVGVVAGELDEQHRVRLAADEAVDDRAEHRDVARQLDHRAVDQLDRARAQLDDVLRSPPSPCRRSGNGRCRGPGAAGSAARSSSIALKKARVPSEPTSRCAMLWPLHRSIMSML